MPVEEGERSSAATADSACANCRADEPYEAPKQKFWSEVGSLKQDWDHGLGRGASFILSMSNEQRLKQESE